MSTKELQQRIADAINEVEELVQGGCKAIAEDSLSVVAEVEQQLSQAAGVAIVVTTPSFTRDGCAADKIPVDGLLDIRCIEIVASLCKHYSNNYCQNEQEQFHPPREMRVEYLIKQITGLFHGLTVNLDLCVRPPGNTDVDRSLPADVDFNIFVFSDIDDPDFLH